MYTQETRLLLTSPFIPRVPLSVTFTNSAVPDWWPNRRSALIQVTINELLISVCTRPAADQLGPDGAGPSGAGAGARRGAGLETERTRDGTGTRGEELRRKGPGGLVQMDSGTLQASQRRSRGLRRDRRLMDNGARGSAERARAESAFRHGQNRRCARAVYMLLDDGDIQSTLGKRDGCA